MPRLVQPLTDFRIRSAKPKAKTYKIFDGGGLYLEVPHVGNKRWRMKYLFGGREGLLSFGVYPEVSLDDARDKRADARRLIANGVDPGQIRREQREATQAAPGKTFAAVATLWLEKKRGSWKPDHFERIETSLKSDVYPAIGERAIDSITTRDTLAIVQLIETRGALDVAARVAQRMASVFRHGILIGKCQSNPAAELRGVVKQRKVQHRAALSLADLPEFLDKLDRYDGRPETRLAIRLLMLTFVRPGELRGALWKEFDLDRTEWRIPADRMKMGEEHIVPLSTQAIVVLRELRVFTSWSPLLFPGNGEGDKPISENTVLFALYRMGYHKKATAHGFRTLASTSLNELGWRPDLIEKQLAHEERRSEERRVGKECRSRWAPYH